MSDVSCGASYDDVDEDALLIPHLSSHHARPKNRLGLLI